MLISMNQDATTLYKLMILYMLNKVNFPLSNSQISEYMLEHQYTNYFNLQEILNDLSNNNFVQVLTYRNSTQYRLTKEGSETISFFNTKISQAIRDEIDNYLLENKYDLKCEVGTTADYYRSTNGDYIVHCKVEEGDSTLIELNLSVPLESQAEAMCLKWREGSQDIYEFAMKKLM